MIAAEAVQLFRADIGAANAYFPIADELYRQLNFGYIDFVRQLGGTPDALDIDIDTDDDEVILPSYVMKTRSVKRASDRGEVGVINYTDLLTGRSNDYGNTVMLDSGRTGTVRQFVIGERRGFARLIAVPAADDTLNLLIDRLPLNTIEDDDSEFVDLEPEHHTAMVDWLMAKAFRRRIDGLYSPKDAEYHENRYDAAITKAKDARQLAEAKVRVVQYGGI